MTPDVVDRRVEELLNQYYERLPEDQGDFLADLQNREPAHVCARFNEVLGFTPSANLQHFGAIPPSFLAVYQAPAEAVSGAVEPGLSTRSLDFSPLPMDLGWGSQRRLGIRYSDFIRALLHRRLLIATSFGCGIFAFFLAKDFVTGDYHIDKLHADFFVHAVSTLGLFVLAVVLWLRPSLGILWLRVVELVVLGLVILFSVRLQFELMSQSPEFAASSWQEDIFLLISDRISLRWFVMLVGYGLFVPNTLRRSLIVHGVLVAIPLTVGVAVSAAGGSLGSAAESLLEMSLWLVVGSTLAIYASFKIATLRKVGFESQKMDEYQLKRLLGAGGMGQVWLAEDTVLRRPCALKIIRPDRIEDPRMLRRFEREVWATAQLNHANIVTIYHSGYAQDGTFYYVMEYVSGLDLWALVTHHGRLSPARAVFLLKQASEALHHAHCCGLIHRDIKPHNMLVCDLAGKHDQLKLVDFGLAREFNRKADGPTATGENGILGTPAFMSPEQVACKGELDARSDIYSLGAVAYFLLTGRPPFEGDTYVDILFAHLHRHPDPLSTERPEVSADLETVVLRCLEKDPARRFPSAAVLAEALSRCDANTTWTGQHAANWWREKAPEGTQDVK